MPYFRKSTLAGGAIAAVVLAFGTTAAMAGADTASATDGQSVVVQQPFADTRNEAVNFADLNLRRESDRERLEMRLDSASRRVCNVGRGSALDDLPTAKSCVTRAQADAFAELETRGILARSPIVASAGMK